MKLRFHILLVLIYIKVSEGTPVNFATTTLQNIFKPLNNTRRIIHGYEVTQSKEYMVYLQTPADKNVLGRHWLCGGIIIHDEYILTSAACIQDVVHFYVVSGTYQYSEHANKDNNECIKNTARKAVWKCIPKNYDFDGKSNDNIKWMNNDIAVVRVDDGFDFSKRQRGCDFIPKPIVYNNHSQALENPGNLVCIAGWGTTSEWGTGKERQQNLMQVEVEIIPKARCKRRWGIRYRNIIDNYMICTKDIGQTMSEVCNEKYVDCHDIDYSDEESDEGRRVQKVDSVPTNLKMHSARDHVEELVSDEEKKFDQWSAKEKWARTERSRRAWSGMSKAEGGFCENDHGGPMIFGHGKDSVAIGIISACLVKERTNRCYGPFLYTSIYKNRQFISCAIYKEVEECRRQFRSGVTYQEQVISWKNHPDGPAKNEK